MFKRNKKGKGERIALNGEAQSEAVQPWHQMPLGQGYAVNNVEEKTSLLSAASTPVSYSSSVPTSSEKLRNDAINSSSKGQQVSEALSAPEQPAIPSSKAFDIFSAESAYPSSSPSTPSPSSPPSPFIAPTKLIEHSTYQKSETTFHNNYEEIQSKDSSNEKSVTVVLSSPPSSELPPQKAPFTALMTVYWAIAVHGISMNIAQPFLPEMLRGRFNVPEAEVGKWAGIIMSSYAFASFMSASYLGHLSDIFGRKFLLALGAATITICTFFFGIATTVWMAFAARLTEGLISGIPVLARAALSDIAERDPDRNSYFAYYGAVFSLSLSIASALGGIVSGQVKSHLPEVDPHMAACVVAASLCFLSFIGIVIWMPNTKGGSTQKPTALSEKIKTMSAFQRMRFLLSDWVIRRSILIMGLANMGNGAVLLSFTLLLTLPTNHYGQGFTGFESGMAYTLFGVIGFIFQVMFFKKLDKKYGARKLILFGAICLFIGCLLLPAVALSVSPAERGLLWFGVSIALIIMGIGNMNSFPCALIFLGNATDFELQGISQGLGRMVGAFMRGLGIFTAGQIFSFSLTYGVPWLLFVFIIAIYFSLALLSLTLPAYVETGKPREPVEEDTPAPK